MLPSRHASSVAALAVNSSRRATEICSRHGVWDSWVNSETTRWIVGLFGPPTTQPSGALSPMSPIPTPLHGASLSAADAAELAAEPLRKAAGKAFRARSGTPSACRPG